jgi:hypothetical protein
MSIKGRLETIERRMSEHGDGLVVIFVRGGFSPDSSNDHATAGGLEFNRGADESPLAFRERCEQAACEMNATTLVFGGLGPTTWKD